MKFVGQLVVAAVSLLLLFLGIATIGVAVDNPERYDPACQTRRCGVGYAAGGLFFLVAAAAGIRAVYVSAMKED